MKDSDLKDPGQNLIIECKDLRAILAKSCATARKKDRPPDNPSG